LLLATTLPVAGIAPLVGSGTAAAALTPVKRVNAGGAKIAVAPPWRVDSKKNPSPWGNAAQNGNQVMKTTAAIDMTHRSVPAGTPTKIFKTARIDPKHAPIMRWAIPVADGDYRVRTYYAETNATVKKGMRVFDVLAEGAVVIDDLDVRKRVGLRRALQVGFDVTVSDGVLDLAFARGVGNPMVSGIEVLVDDGVPPPPPEDKGTWAQLDDTVQRREEASFIQVNGAFYLAGGNNPAIADPLKHEKYEPDTNTWTGTLAIPPAEAGYEPDFHHVQSVHIGDQVYYLGGLTGAFPNAVYGGVQIYDISDDAWSLGDPMSSARARGAGGAVVHGGDNYYAGGLIDDGADTGHEGTSVPYFDRYDPATGEWTALDDMPRPRDHFYAVVVDDKLYAVGGRVDGAGNRFQDAQQVKQVDVYDFGTGDWSTLPAAANIPVARAGAATVVVDGEIIVLGGEARGQAYDRVDAFDPSTNTWRVLTDLPTPRHGIQGAVCNGAVYIASGAEAQGGSMLTKETDVLYFGDSQPSC
jgi:hypothetical protein